MALAVSLVRCALHLFVVVVGLIERVRGFVS